MKKRKQEHCRPLYWSERWQEFVQEHVLYHLIPAQEAVWLSGCAGNCDRIDVSAVSPAV